MTIKLDNIEEWVNTLNTMNVCDSKCREKETIKQRRKELTDAIHNYNTAKPRLRQAKHNYMKLIQSETNYNTYLKNENQKKAKEIIRKKKISKDNKLKEIENKVKYFNNSEIFTEALKYKLPESGLSNPRSKFINVVFPEPVSPIIPIRSPLIT